MKPLQTKFSADVSEHSALSEYPRPCLVRTSYLNLNGRWDYAFTDSPDIPQQFEGTILVPFSPECALSGVNKRLEPKGFLWYRRTFSITRPQPGKRILLHFGAVDQIADAAGHNEDTAQIDHFIPAEFSREQHPQYHQHKQ